MDELAQTHSSLPYLLTIVVACAFLIFGLYGISADKKINQLPFLKPAIFVIAGIYLFRGLVELIFDLEGQQTNKYLEILYSLIAILLGFCISLAD